MGNVLFYDNQRGCFSSHTSIDTLSVSLIIEWWDTVERNEDYEGEAEYERKKWEHPTEEMKREIIERNEFTIIDNPTEDDIEQWKKQNN